LNVILEAVNRLADQNRAVYYLEVNQMFKLDSTKKLYPLWTMLIGLISFLIGGIITETMRIVPGLSGFIQGEGPFITLPITGGIGLLLLGLLLQMGKKTYKMVIVGLIGSAICHFLIIMLMFRYFYQTGNWGNFLYVLLMNIVFGAIFGTFIYGVRSAGLFFAVCGIVALPYGLLFMYMDSIQQLHMELIRQENWSNFFALLNSSILTIGIGTGIGLSIGLYSLLKAKNMDSALWPKTVLGKAAALLSIAFITLILIKMSPVSFPMNIFAIAGIGMAGLIVGFVAIIKQDRGIVSFLSILLGIAIIGSFVLLWISSAGLFKDFPVKKTLTQAEAGEASGKDVNFGFISESGGWIYYVYEGHLYKRKIDWTEKTKVTDDNINLMYIKDGIIYYELSTPADVFNLHRINTDGTGKMKISADNFGNFVISGDWIYYNINNYPLPEGLNESEMKDFYEASKILYKMKTDGSEKVKLAEIGSYFIFPKILGDWIYYSTGNDDLYKIRTDGTEQTLVAKNAWKVYVSGDWAYHVTKTYEGNSLETINIWREKADGTEKSATATLNGVYAYAFDSDWFYYSSGKGLSRIKLDGTGTEELNDVVIGGLFGVSGDWMYTFDYGGHMFRVKLDGSVGTRLN
jgi:hypothetical protein